MQPLRCQVGLNGLNFFIAAVQTGFGPFFSVYLTEQGWSQVDIGFALSVGTGAVLISQLPAGALVDLIHHKRLAVGLGLLLVGVSALVLIMQPTPGPVGVCTNHPRRRQLHPEPRDRRADAGVWSATLPSANGWVSTRDTHRLAMAAAAAGLGALASYVSERAVFIATAAMVIPALACLPLFRIRRQGAGGGSPCPAASEGAP